VWEIVKKTIQDNTCFIICTHRDPDADGVSSELALGRMLEGMGKKVTILNPDSLPQILKFLDPEGVIRGYDSLGREESRRLLDEAGAIFFLDAGIWKRLYPMNEEVAARVGKVISIDHHPTDKLLSPGSVALESASSTGELIFDLIKELDCPLDERIAYWLYCAIVKDTGCFRFENTNSKVFRIAAELTKYGLKPHEVYDVLFERISINSTVCLARVLATLGFAYNNRLAYIYLTRKVLEETGASFEETDNFVNVIRSIDPVEACLFFRESNNGQIRVSLRSKSSEIDVNKLAGKFGGGGHKRASGALISGSIEEVIRKVVDGAAELFA